MLWTFKGFVDDQGCREIEEWYKTLPSAAQAKLDWILDLFKSRTPAQWSGTKFFKRYEGYDGLWEIRWEIGKKWYRPLGAFGPNRQDYTILIGATKNQKDELIPKEAPNIAEKRLDAIKANPERAKECNFEPEETTTSEETSE